MDLGQETYTLFINEHRLATRCLICNYVCIDWSAFHTCTVLAATLFMGAIFENLVMFLGKVAIGSDLQTSSQGKVLMFFQCLPGMQKGDMHFRCMRNFCKPE